MTQFFQQQVLPQISANTLKSFAAAYPHISVRRGRGMRLGECHIVMLVALTGTGKTTTLQHLGHTVDATVLPTRRDLADMVVIPAAQILADDPLEPVTDRAHRFEYTRSFAQHFDGGFAEAYNWLHLVGEIDNDAPLISEGIRGPDEIAYALDHFPGWRVIELSAQPITRLKRLSRRRDVFDQVSGEADLGFLPVDQREAVERALQDGEITHKALTIMQAEAKNYGLSPYGRSHSAYTHIETDILSPVEVAQRVRGVIGA